MDISIFFNLFAFFDRFRYVRSRAMELRTLRRRFAKIAQQIPKQSDERKRMAQEMRALRVRICASLGTVQACTSCARGCPLPMGQWEGGFCCSGQTALIFSDAEIAMLVMSGTHRHDLRAPRGAHAGCVFRGPKGCSLLPVHRPNQCLRYVCRELGRELVHREDARELAAMCEQLQALFEEASAL